MRADRPGRGDRADRTRPTVRPATWGGGRVVCWRLSAWDRKHRRARFSTNLEFRPGTGSMTSPKPRTLKYAETLQAVEERVVEALPEIIDALIGRAKAGDLKAATYLADHVLGRTAGAKIAPADDRERPYDETAYELDEQEREEDHDIRRILAINGARQGA